MQRSGCAAYSVCLCSSTAVPAANASESACLFGCRLFLVERIRRQVYPARTANQELRPPSRDEVEQCGITFSGRNENFVSGRTPWHRSPLQLFAHATCTQVLVEIYFGGWCYLVRSYPGSIESTATNVDGEEHGESSGTARATTVLSRNRFERSVDTMAFDQVAGDHLVIMTERKFSRRTQNQRLR